MEDEDVAAAMDRSGVDRMLQLSVKPSTLAKYSRLWDKWVSFSSQHEVETMPPDMRALEVFLVDRAELSGSAGVANSTAAVIALFSALEGFPSLFSTPRFSKIMRAVKLTFRRPSKPKKPFKRDHIIRFM
jgi:hypothetical protein